MKALLIILLSIAAAAVGASYLRRASVQTETAPQGAAYAALLADLHSGKLSTPEAFQSRCGQARWIRQTSSGPVLHYSSGDILVSFTPSGSTQFARVFTLKERGRYRDATQPASEEFALEHLRCK